VMCGADKLLRIKRKDKEDFQDEDQRKRQKDRQEDCWQNYRDNHKGREQTPNSDFPNVTILAGHDYSLYSFSLRFDAENVKPIALRVIGIRHYVASTFDLQGMLDLLRRPSAAGNPLGHIVTFTETPLMRSGELQNQR